MSLISSKKALPDIILFHDQLSNDGQDFDNDAQIKKKQSLKRITLRTGQSSLNAGEVMMKNPLHQNQMAEEMNFENNGVKSTLNPERSGDFVPHTESEITYEPGKRKKNRVFLPPLLKSSSTKREQIQLAGDGPTSGHREQDSTSQIMLNSTREQYSPAKLPTRPVQMILYRIPNEILDKKTFMLTPIPQGLLLQCSIRRDKSTISKKLYTQYTLQVSQNYQFLAVAKQLPYHCSSTYSMSLKQDRYSFTDESCVAQVKSNFWGSLFEIKDMSNKEQPTMAGTVRYESSCCGPSGPRKMEADVVNMSYNKSTKHLEELSGVGLGIDNHSVMELVSKKPRYDEEKGVYRMKFNSRVKMSSVKNFILVKKDGSDDRNILLFGKSSKEIFNLDFTYPLSPMQAFAIALTSFDSKIISQ